MTDEPIDARWLYAVTLSGVTFAFAMANATTNPDMMTVAIAFELGAVFLMVSLIQVPAELGVLSTKICRLSGHEWDLEPPWSGKELRYRPQCEACGYRPDDIAIVGKHEGDHRV